MTLHNDAETPFSITIPYAELPSQHNLFLDFLYEFENVQEFYPHNFRDESKYAAIFDGIIKNRKTDGNRLSEILTCQYSERTPSPAALLNIAKLKERNTICVLTGQQVGICGGPLYTFYKIITAIKLSKQLSEKFPYLSFVPVFWLAGDDHDFDEIREIGIINKENRFVRIRYGSAEEQPDERKSVGTIPITDEINTFFASLKSEMRETEFTESIFTLLTECYREGKTFSEAFGDLLFRLFDAYGLVLFNPQDTAVKELLRPVFLKEAKDFRTHAEILIRNSAHLEETYHAQVKLRPVNLFLNTGEGRFAVEPTEEHGFRLKRKKIKYTAEEFYALIQEKPEQFSANVLLRPICQDFLFPTGFYIGGPSEVSYYAQIKPLYELFGISPSIVFPRSSATIMEKQIAGVLEKYFFQLQDFYTRPEEIPSNIIAQVSTIRVEDLFAEAGQAMSGVMEILKIELDEMDKTLGGAADRYLSKILQYLNEYKGKAAEAQKRKYEVAIKQVEKAMMQLIPEGSLQEREINFFSYANKYGIELFDIIYRELVPTLHAHKLIEL